MVVIDNHSWSGRIRYLSRRAKDDPTEYFHHEVVYNCRLTNVQAAQGVAQMKALYSLVWAKRRVAERGRSLRS